METGKQMIADIKGKLDELEAELDQLEKQGLETAAPKRSDISWLCRMC